jgi:cytochrome P450
VKVADFNPYDPEVQDDPYPVYARLRRESPVAFSEELDVWFLFRCADVIEAAHDHGRFVSSEGVALLGGRPVAGVPMIVSTDNPDHDRLRALVSRRFTARALAELEAPIRRYVAAAIDGFVARGSCELMDELAIPIPLLVIGDLLGVASEDRHRFRAWAEALVHLNPTEPDTVATARAAGMEIGTYMLAAIEERRGQPGDDLISWLLGSTLDGEAVDVGVVLGFAFLFIVAGSETTTNLIGNGMIALARHPDQRAAVRKDPALISGMVEEILRYDGPVQGVARVVNTDVRVAGLTLPAGAKVQLRWGSANRDEDEYDVPDTFDVRRRVGRQVAFGHGIHYCLGAALSRLEGRVVFEELLHRLGDWEVPDRIDRLASGEVRGPASLPLRFSPSEPGRRR